MFLPGSASLSTRVLGLLLLLAIIPDSSGQMGLPGNEASQRWRQLKAAQSDERCCYASGLKQLEESTLPRPKSMAFIIGAQKSGESTPTRAHHAVTAHPDLGPDPWQDCVQ